MTSGPPQLDIVIPVYGGWEFVEQCLAALERQTVPVNVFVIDDRSPDDTLVRMRDRFPGFTVLANETNSGFAVSCNRGIRAGSAPFVVLLNSDVVARDDFAAQMMDAFTAGGDRVGSVGPVLLGPDGTVDSFGVTVDVTGAGYVRYHGALADRIDSYHPRPVGPYGAAAGYRRRALEAVGLLDENIFMYGEELELALRMTAGKWETKLVPFVAGTHIGGASSGKASTRQLYLSSFGRGYLLRVYRVLRGRHAFRALLSEIIVVGMWTLVRWDLVALRGRWSGWRRGAGVPARRLDSRASEPRITFWRGMKMRRAGYWAGDPALTHRRARSARTTTNT